MPVVCAARCSSGVAEEQHRSDDEAAQKQQNSCRDNGTVKDQDDPID